MDIVLLFALAFHTIAFVIAWGYYGILGRIVMPALARSLDVDDQARTLIAIERRAVPFVALSAVLFLVTGTYLLVVDPSYEGLGDFTSSWATWMLVKHIVVGALVIVAIGIDLLVRRLPDALDRARRLKDLRMIRYASEGATALGALIVLLTVAAQLSA